MQSVWSIGMLSQGNMVAPLYHYTGQVGPDSGTQGHSRSENEAITSWLRWYQLQTASNIYIRHMQSVWASGILSQGRMDAPLYHYNGQVGPRFGDSGSLVEWKWCHNVMVEAGIHLRPLHAPMIELYKVFELLVCCLKGIWVHPFTVTPTKLDPDLGTQVHLRSGNDAITSWLRLIFTSDRFIHPY